jgi:hypothetical protein
MRRTIAFPGGERDLPGAMALMFLPGFAIGRMNLPMSELD